MLSLLWAFRSLRSRRTKARLFLSAGTLAAALLLVGAAPSLAREWIVPDDAPTVAAAIDSAQAGDVVTLTAGTYYEYDLAMKDQITLRGATGVASDVVIDAQYMGRVMDASFVSATTVIEDLTLTNGSTLEVGGGLYLLQSYVSVENCRFVDNECYQEGGEGAGAYVFEGEPQFSDCVFEGNVTATPGAGGAIYIDSSDPTISGCRFKHNFAGAYGGAVGMYYSSPDILDCVFISNSAGEGGAISVSNSSPTIDGCTIVRGNAFGSGGSAIALFSTTAISISNTIIAFGQGGGSVYTDITATANMSCCDVYGNAGGDYISFLSGLNGTSGNISEDPLFCDLQVDDVSLTPCSPCLNETGCLQMGAEGIGCTGRTWYVPSQAPTIAAAIDSAAACDTIDVAAGTYFEQNLVMKSGVTMRGEVDLYGANLVTIDGQGYERIMYGAGLDSTTVIERLTFSWGDTTGVAGTGGALRLESSYARVRSCDFTHNSSESGGALSVDGGAPRFEDCVFDENESRGSGGAVVARLAAEPVFERCAFTNNTSTTSAIGGAMSCYSTSDVTLIDCVFSSNLTDGNGGAIYIHASNLSATGCEFTHNLAELNGGALSAIDTSVELTGCLISHNDSPLGSGLNLSGTSTATVDHSIVSFGITGEAIRCRDSATADLSCCDIYGNEGGDYVGCVTGEMGIDGNFSLDPEFCRPDSSDFGVSVGSPCLDAPGCGLIGGVSEGCGFTIHVPADYATIQEGLNAAAYGDTVVVACGVYDEGDIDLKDGVYLTSQTGEADCVTIAPSFPIKVFYSSGDGPGTVVRGFTLVGSQSVSDPGVGMFLNQSDVVVENCEFRRLESLIQGGGVHMEGDSAPTFTNCVFDSCSSMGDGGALSGIYAQPVFEQCVFVENSAGYDGGAAWFGDGLSAVFDECTFSENSGVSGGSAIACVSDMLYREAAACTLRNSIIAFGTGSAGAATCAGTGSVTLECCDVYGNGGGDYTQCLAGQNGVNGNISEDPLFCGNENPSSPLTLASNSPCAASNQPTCGRIGAYGVGCTGQADWDGEGDGSTWEDPDNWDPDQVPGTGDHARIQLPGTYTVTVNSNRAVDSLTLGPATGDITLEIQSNTLTVTNTLTNSETIVVRDGGALDAPNAGRASSIVNESGATFQLDDGDIMGNGSFLNRGYFRKTGAGRSYVYVDLSNDVYGGRGDDGLMEAEAGTLDVGGEFENLGRLNINTGQSTMISKHYVGRDGPRAGSGTFVNAGLVDIADGGSLTALPNVVIMSAGDMDNRGELAVGANASFYNENGGQFDLDDGDLMGPGSFVNRGYFRTLGSGTSTILLNFTNEYAGRGDDGLVEAESGTLDVGGEFENLGRLNINTGQSTMVSKHYLGGRGRAGSGTFVNSGTVDLAAGALLRANANTDVSSSGDFEVGGLLEVEPGAQFQSSGDVDVEPGGDFAAKGTVANQAGGDFVNRGRTSIPSGGSMTNEGYFDHRENALLRGSGTFDTSGGLASMKGVVEPGDSPGTLSFIGDFVQTATSQIRVEIGGYAPGDDHDVLSVDGDTEFDGAIELIFVDGFTPVEGDSFDVIVETRGRTGDDRDVDFDCFSGLDVSDTLYMEPLQRPTAFRFRATSGSLGNEAPAAADDYGSVSGYAAVSVPVLANDYDADLDDLYVLEVFSGDAAGEAYVDAGDSTVSYFALPGFAGADSFRYVVGDCVSGSDTAWVRIDVTAPPRTWRVPEDAPTIQAGIDSAAVGDTVLVACGTYHESGITPKSGVTLLSETGEPDCVTIDASGRAGRGFAFDGVDHTCVVAGFTVTGGYPDGPGGGMHFDASSASVSDCIVTGNTASYGGGVYITGRSTPVLEGCVLTSNEASFGGGAVACSGESEPEIMSCTIAGNGAPEGAALHTAGSSLALMGDCILAFSTFGEAVSCTTGGAADIFCTDIYGNYGGDWVGCVSDQAGENGNFSLDPMFCAPESLNYRLQEGSPCSDPPGCGLVGALPVGCSPAPDEPDIEVTPLVLDLVAEERAAVCDSLQLGNEGAADLTWRIREAAPAGRAKGRSASGSRPSPGNPVGPVAAVEAVPGSRAAPGPAPSALMTRRSSAGHAGALGELAKGEID
ncbi:MAG: hypothetical protein GF400_02310, partial [Candidatus Eisenbacteria bacterium]|nr:hypothetical protein [Candidatus Eisenbacteria bacterium]